MYICINKPSETQTLSRRTGRITPRPADWAYINVGVGQWNAHLPIMFAATHATLDDSKRSARASKTPGHNMCISLSLYIYIYIYI